MALEHYTVIHLTMIKPIGERILIKRIEKESEGLELAEVHSQEITEGEVVALGDSTEAMCIAKLGDIVIISKYSGEEYIDGEDIYKIVDCKHILAVK